MKNHLKDGKHLKYDMEDDVYWLQKESGQNGI